MKRTLLPAALLALGLSVALTSNLLAQQNNQNRNPQRDQNQATQRNQTADKEDFNNVTDEEFVRRVAMGNLAEIEMGRMAMQHGDNADLRHLASLIDDHGKANDELARLAANKGIQIPRQVDKTHKDKADQLAKVKGADFIHSFAQDMIKDHKKDIALFEHEAKNGKDKDIRAFAEKTLPTLKVHLKMAEDLAGEKGETKK